MTYLSEITLSEDYLTIDIVINQIKHFSMNDAFYFCEKIKEVMFVNNDGQSYISIEIQNERKFYFDDNQIKVYKEKWYEAEEPLSLEFDLIPSNLRIKDFIKKHGNNYKAFIFSFRGIKENKK